ncbi:MULTISPECIES: outer membrane protein assembly factor BamA [unclassified Saccharibacter]|uniref:outer membrane protein assembly factor BamA n=1 Tax=unclassified Saccharibacter TaxID=2648722 RepID=UPI001324CA06|nr:outer membrane protein assembly factor BamA [Saccharibacter sp. EH611]MXV57005.1 outer membrane protein assembly factor BamA [Saccharibacter sp. EH70]MXV66635.1 outer membrane protein assembly factor BamA [Saccharibacter sp. EH60]
MSGIRIEGLRPVAVRLALLASACLFPAYFCDAEAAFVHRQTPHHTKRHHQSAARHSVALGKQDTSQVPEGGVAESIVVKGNTRIETSTVLSYMVVQPGDSFNRDALNRSLKTLYATGLFRDVTFRREGSTLLVQLVENPIVNRIVFEGNHALKDAEIMKELNLRPRAVFSTQTIAADRQKILNMYAGRARYGATVTPQIIRLSHNRVDVIFNINEARQSLVKKIVFVGNHSFSEAALSNVVSSKESAWYRFFSSSDEYNPERVRYDAELLRRFYLHNGFVDFRMIDATGELSPDHKTFYITFTFKEGPRYRLGKIDVRSNIHHVTAKMMRPHIEVYKNQYYDGTAIQNNSTDMQDWLQGNGHPFAMVRTEIARNPEKKIVNLLYDIVEGPHVYVERLDVNGNTITRDSVIRRNLPVAEGDAYTPSTRKYARMALQDLGYFSSVSVDQNQGSAPDKVDLSANVTEKPTGEFSLGGGYSTDVGVLGNLALKQHNLLGTGVDAGFSGTVAYYEKQADLSLTDPYFLGRNFVAGADIYFVQNNYQTYQSYNEGQYGLSLRLGYAYNRYLSQSWTYTLVDRHVGNSYPHTEYPGFRDDVSSIYVLQSAGWSLLSQISTTLTYDRRDNRMSPHSGFMLSATGDFAGLGGDEKYARGKFTGAYYIPLDDITGSHSWTVQLKGGVGYMGDWGGRHSDRNIIDNFYLGGQNLRGFLQGGVGPRSGHIRGANGQWIPGYGGQEDLLGGRFMYTASAQLNFPLPMGDSFGISGRGFIDAGSLAGTRVRHHYTSQRQDGSLFTPINGNTFTPRVAGGLGISWQSPFGLVNIDGAVPIHKERGDRVYPIRFGFGQQF